MNSPLRLSEQMLPSTSPAGMSRTSALPGENMFDGGPTSKVGLNNQAFNNQRLAEQNEQVNKMSAMHQAQAAAVMGVRKKQLIDDNAVQKAIGMREQYKAEMAEVMASPAIREMSRKTPIEIEKMRKDVAITKASAIGINPDLVA